MFVLPSYQATKLPEELYLKRGAVRGRIAWLKVKFYQ